MPKGKYGQLRAKLEAQGIQVLDYTEGDIESRQAAIDTVEDLKFKTSKNTTDPEADGEDPDIRYKVSAGDVGDKAASGQKKPSNSTASPLTRRPGNQGSVGSTQLMPSTAAAELLNIDNINDLNNSVKKVIADLGAFYVSVEN